MLTYRSFKRELFTVFISHASEEIVFPEEDFHKNPFDKDFVVLDVIHHKSTGSEMSRHISVKEPIAIPCNVKTSSSFPCFGPSASLSDNEQTILIGAPWVDDYLGASWVFNYNSSNDTWYQQAKLVGTYTPSIYSTILQGKSASLSLDGTYALIDGPGVVIKSKLISLIIRKR